MFFAYYERASIAQLFMRASIVEGEQRYLAAKSAGLKQIPCFIRNLNDNEALLESFKENLLRKNLEPIEEARFLEKLKKIYPNNFYLAEIINKSESYVRNRLKLLDLDESLRSALTLRKAEYLSELGKEKQKELAPKIKSMNLKNVKEIVDKIKYPKFSRRILKPSRYLVLTEKSIVFMF